MPTDFRKELIDSIRNEAKTFDMEFWNTCGMFGIQYHKPTQCGTESCMAGHIEALRPELAAKLAPEFPFDNGISGAVDHVLLASAIWCHETGEAFCPLDFMGDTTVYLLSDKKELNREAAVAHILGKNKSWPLLTAQQVHDREEDRR